MTETPPLIRCRDVCRTFGATVCLDRLDLDVAAGERIAVIGPSGSGKSTLLRVLMTLTRPASGVVEIDGQPVWTMPGRDGPRPADDRHLRKMRAAVGMVFQHFNLFPHLTALGNVMEAPVQVLALPRAEARARAEDLLTLVGLADKLDRYPSQLSGGQQQRVAIARALAMRPKILLLDEITSALDPETIGEVLNVVQDIGRKHELTMLMVTHHIGFARKFADRICLFHGGRIVEQGRPDDVLDRPRSAEARTFLADVM